jgi:flagellar M-ring protein FliF
MDSPKLGMTQFQEQLAFQRGLEGELARTIQSLSPVESARVHLAIPKPSVFIRDKQTPTASVLVNLHPGRALDPGQVQSIVHLVSSSVPELSPNSVTVVDQSGNLFTAKSDSQSMRGLNSSQLDYIRQMETYYAQRIESIVAPIVGNGNVKAEVRADLDFSETEATSETYKPNPTPDAQAIRSQQSVEDSSTGAGGQAQGVPGALSNQPPGPASAPFNAPQGANAGPAGPNAGPNAEPDARAAGQGAVAAIPAARKAPPISSSTRPSVMSRSRSAASSACRWPWWSTTRRRPRTPKASRASPCPCRPAGTDPDQQPGQGSHGLQPGQGRHGQRGERRLHGKQGGARHPGLEGPGQRVHGEIPAEEPDHFRPGFLSGIRGSAPPSA